MALGKIQNFKYLLFGNIFNSNLSETNGRQSRNYADKCNNKEGSKQGENLAVVLRGINDLKIENRPVPKIKPNQVLLQMEVVGICGSDVHYYKEGRIGPFVVEKPMIIGHEGSGTVVECGPAVKTLKSGDRVAIEPQVNCRMCAYCKTGLYFCATPPDDGNLCRYYAHDSDFCFKLPDHLDFEYATLMEPLAVGVHACKRGGVTSGDSVLVLGSGPIGLVSILAARAYGASKIVATDVDDFKLKKANELGVDCACNIKGLNVDETLEIIKSVLPEPPRVTIDCCGFEDAVKVGMKATKSGGKVVLVGMGTDKMSLPITECIFREVDLLGVFRYVNDYPTAIDMVSSGKIDPKPLITHHFKFEDSVKAFETAKNKTEDYIKIMIHANPKWQPKC